MSISSTSTTTMATSFGQTPATLSPYDPPTAALPPLPVSKTRKSLPTPTLPASGLPSPAASTSGISPRIPSAPQTPSKLRTPSRGTIPVPTPKTQQQQQAHSNSQPMVPTLKHLQTRAPGIQNPDKPLRKSVSIASFPQPPRPSTKIGRPSIGSIASSTGASSVASKENSPITPTTPAPKSKKLKKSSSSNTLNSVYSGGPSLLNGSSGSVPLDAVGGILTPSDSRSSSAQGSATGTDFEDMEATPKVSRKNSDETSSRRSTLKEGKGNVVVSVRVRPNGEADAITDGEWMVDGRRSLISFKGKEGGDYYYDNVFSPHDNNAKLYEVSAKRLVRRVMEGYHGTVFAYGMTGTGKTFSMQGIESQPGIIPQAVTDIFSYIRETPHREFLLRASYLEIYNEDIRDLLTTTPPGGQADKIQLREDRKRGVYATPVKEEIVQSPMQLLRVISRGDRARHTGTTQYNLHSSRSHAIVKIVVESRERSAVEGGDVKAAGGVRVSSLSLIDLAGSEKAADTKERRTEGAHINKSLLTLGTVIARLSGDKDKSGNPTDKDGKHLPYRDSKLTRLLQPALSGTSLISILCTIQIGSTGSAATANSHTVETINTLKFAARAKNNIVSHAKKAEEAMANASDPGSIALLDHYRTEIATLRSQLDTSVKMQSKAEEVIAKAIEEQTERETEDRHKDQMLEMQLARTALKERIEHLNRLILCSQSTGVNSDRSMSAMSIHPALSSAYSTVSGGRSVRSSASASTIGRSQSVASQNTISTHFAQLRSPVMSTEQRHSQELLEEDELGDDVASLQAQNNALQLDLVDKNRYISTLERRLLQARRSSNTRTSLGPSVNSVQEKDSEIADLRSMLEDRERTISSLRASIATFSNPDESATTTPISSSARNHHASDSFGSSSAATSHSMTFPQTDAPTKTASSDSTTVTLREASGAFSSSPSQPPRDLPPPPPTKDLPPIPRRQSADGVSSTSYTRTPRDRVGALRDSSSSNPHRKSIDEMSRMLDEMIQEKVERGELVTDAKRGVMRVASTRRQESSASNNLEQKTPVEVPSVEALLTGARSRTDSLERERDAGKGGVKNRDLHVGLGFTIE